MVKARKVKSGMIVVNLEDVDGLAKKLQDDKAEVVHRLSLFASKWGDSTRNIYASKISYSTGFKRSKKYNSSHPFSEVDTPDEKGLVSINIGHTSFLAKFLEVGSITHVITPKIRGEKRAIVISGIKGTKALYNAFTSQKKELISGVERELNDLLQGR